MFEDMLGGILGGAGDAATASGGLMGGLGGGGLGGAAGGLGVGDFIGMLAPMLSGDFNPMSMLGIMSKLGGNSTLPPNMPSPGGMGGNDAGQPGQMPGVAPQQNQPLPTPQFGAPQPSQFGTPPLNSPQAYKAGFADTLRRKIFAIAPNADPAIVKAMMDNSSELIGAGINTPDRVNHFLSQTAQETGGYKYSQELPSSYASSQSQYKGRGLIQLTGKDNYRSVGNALGVDLIHNPQLAADPNMAVKIAAEYWKQRNLNTIADTGGVRGVTRAINGGYNGLNDRANYYNKLASLRGF